MRTESRHLQRNSNRHSNRPLRPNNGVRSTNIWSFFKSPSGLNRSVRRENDRQVGNLGSIVTETGKSSQRVKERDIGRPWASLVVLLLALWLELVPATLEAAGVARPDGPPAPTIVFMTDFGVANDAVAICKGVMWSINPDLRIVDLTHQVTPYSILDGARFLAGASPYYPSSTVFVTVIDPGVGSARKAVVVKSKRGQYFVLPDNGLITLVADRDGIEGAREITNPSWMRGEAISSSFHGRDIFSPVGAHLAQGEDWTEVGPELEVKSLVRLNIPLAKKDEKGIAGEIIALDDPFGSLISNIEGKDFLSLGYAQGDKVRVTLGERRMVLLFAKTFSDVPVAEPLVYIDSRGYVGLAVNQRDFARTYSVKPPLPIFVARKGKEGSEHE